MTGILAILTVLGLVGQDAPRIADQPNQVCVDAPHVVFLVENPGPESVFVTLRVERLSGDDDASSWTVVQEDVTERQALSKKVQRLSVDAHGRRAVTWDLKKRIGPPPMVTGRHRLVAVFSKKAGDSLGQFVHPFVVKPCD